MSPNGNYKVSIQDMIGAGKKKNGIEGMETKRVIIPSLEKPTSFSIPRDAKPRSFIEVVQ